MPSFVGRLTKDGQVVSEWLTFNYATMRSGNFVSYPGTIDLPQGVSVDLGAYTVELRNGGRCSVLVHSSNGRIAEFKINGRPPA